jgi:hypothetical protein
VDTVDSAAPKSGSENTDESRPADLKTDISRSARIYDYLLGGKDNFPADRQAAAEIAKNPPAAQTSLADGA